MSKLEELEKWNNDYIIIDSNKLSKKLSELKASEGEEDEMISVDELKKYIELKDAQGLNSGMIFKAQLLRFINPPKP